MGLLDDLKGVAGSVSGVTGTGSQGGVVGATLPGVVDHLTPGGKMPSESELADLLTTVDPAAVTAT